ncbi:MAG: S-methyl-5-thioribose-1-phosphate isomerase [Eggerthellaceae bacterium]|nr:S-methyl-5-thioribose-1-phosphate isomerase [Eggerthellaceae bacterium]
MAKSLKLENIPRTVHVRVDGSKVVFEYVDQRLLPGELRMCATSEWREVVDAIKSLAVRGAPAIGIAGASAIALWMGSLDVRGCWDSSSAMELAQVASEVAGARPTAVNLAWAVEKAKTQVETFVEEGISEIGSLCSRICSFINEMEREDESTNRAIGEHGASLLSEGTRVLTHCNAGSLATSFFGTALGVVYAAAEQGKIERVFADETRPVGQGARLTTWELSRAGVPVTLICDNMAASLMASGGVDAVVVGADRIAANGDTANKIGTLGVAVLAHEFGVPFYVAAPSSTIDLATKQGSEIEIEQRDPAEVLPTPMDGVDVWNPSFDVTPARYITRVITERGAFPPEELVGVFSEQ